MGATCLNGAQSTRVVLLRPLAANELRALAAAGGELGGASGGLGPRPAGAGGGLGAAGGLAGGELLELAGRDQF